MRLGELGPTVGCSSRRRSSRRPVRCRRALDGMAADAATYPVAAWKTYTHTPDDYRLDDERGDALLTQAVALGRPILAVHKGLAGEDRLRRHRPMSARPPPPIPTPPSSSTTRAGRPAPPRVRTRPTCPRRSNEASTVCWPASQAAGIGPDGNVYAELGSTWFNLAATSTARRTCSASC